ncbi:MAG: hypothetical protein QM539_04440 [Alphaproteobacteria bacterium]|nr:hypothetical protein [Alphaproteobacteria bacterium]
MSNKNNLTPKLAKLHLIWSMAEQGTAVDQLDHRSNEFKLLKKIANESGEVNLSFRNFLDYRQNNPKFLNWAIEVIRVHNDIKYNKEILDNLVAMSIVKKPGENTHILTKEERDFLFGIEIRIIPLKQRYLNPSQILKAKNQKKDNEFAMMLLLWSIAYCEYSPGDVKPVSEKERKLFNKIIKDEKIDLKLFNIIKLRKKFKNNETKIVEYACSLIKTNNKIFKETCLKYMKDIAKISFENGSNPIASKEQELISLAEELLFAPKKNK